jgi:hypothetical protein
MEVAGDNPSPLERLLAERVVATWPEVRTFQNFYFQSKSELALPYAGLIQEDKAEIIQSGRQPFDSAREFFGKENG